MKDRLNTKRAMRRLVKQKDLGISLRGLRMNDNWGEAAKRVAWDVSAWLKTHVQGDIPHSRGCTQRLTMALVRWMPPSIALRYLEQYWYTHRAATRYSYPSHNERRMQCPRVGVAPWTDCSGMIRCMWWQAGWPDPAGTDYGTWGNSSMMIAEARRRGRLVPVSQARYGDVFCFEGGVGHAQLYVGRGLCLSNGRDAGPLYVPATAHSGRLYVCRLDPFDER